MEYNRLVTMYCLFCNDEWPGYVPDEYQLDCVGSYPAVCPFCCKRIVEYGHVTMKIADFLLMSENAR